MEYFYHLKPDKIYGSKLLSLSLLNNKFPEMSKQIIQSYGNRKNILNKEISTLNCKWKDVIFFSTLNPRLIFNALEVYGLLNDDVPEILKFPIMALKGKEYCFYQDSKEEFRNFQINEYREETKLPNETRKYFAECAKNKENPLIFSGVKHILVKNELDLSLAQTIFYKKLF